MSTDSKQTLDSFDAAATPEEQAVPDRYWVIGEACRRVQELEDFTGIGPFWL
jgi:hypothetical protein